MWCIIYYIQNLIRHLKFVEDESQQMAYDDQKLSVTQFRAELERYVIEKSMYTALMYRICVCSTFFRDVCQLHAEVHSIEAAEEQFSRQMEEIQASVSYIVDLHMYCIYYPVMQNLWEELIHGYSNLFCLPPFQFNFHMYTYVRA